MNKKKPTFDGGPAESNPNLDPETAHRLDPLAETFAFIPLSGKIPLIKGWPKSKGYSIDDLLKYPNCSTIGARTGLSQDHCSVLILMAKVLGIG